MIDAVFSGELVRASRGRMAHAARWLVGGWLAAEVLVISFFSSKAEGLTADAASKAARELVGIVTYQLVAAILLAGPAFAAGAVTHEKVRRTIEPLFLAEIGAGSIILGKLLARLVQAFVWSLVAWPVLAFIGIAGGVTSVFFASLAIITLLMLAGTCGVGLLASVWTRNTRDAAISVYALMIFVAVPAVAYLEIFWSKSPLVKYLIALDPLYVLDAARDDPNYAVLQTRLGQAVISWGLIACSTTLVAVWRLRPAYFKQLHVKPPGRIARRLSSRPPVGDDAIAWTERYARRRLPTVLVVILIAAVAVMATQWIARKAADADEMYKWFTMAHWLVLMVFMLAAGVRASGCITGERERQTWEPLLTTPWNFDAILRQKCVGVIRSLWPYYFAFLIPGALTLSICEEFHGPDMELRTWAPFAIAAAIAAVFIAQRTRLSWRPFWLTMIAVAAGSRAIVPAAIALTGPLFAYAFMMYMTGVGLWFSARSGNSWWSMLGTTVGGFVLGTVIAFGSTPFGCMPCCSSSLVVGLLSPLGVSGLSSVFDNVLVFIVCSIGAAVGFSWIGYQTTLAAARYLGRHERIPSGFTRMIDLNLPWGQDEPKLTRRDSRCL